MEWLKQKIILASASPRRKELLANAGIPFQVLVTDADEKVKEGLPPDELAACIARRKAEAAVQLCRDRIEEPTAIIAADTIVYINGQVLGKPQDKTQAFTMLRTLSNQWHGVYTGVSVAFMNTQCTWYKQAICLTKIKFKPLTDQIIDRYISHCKPFDKAGAYGIQDQEGRLVEEIVGDYNNVVGLPVDLVLQMINSGD